jgi:hypothetical protein
VTPAHKRDSFSAHSEWLRHFLAAALVSRSVHFPFDASSTMLNIDDDDEEEEKIKCCRLNADANIHSLLIDCSAGLFFAGEDAFVPLLLVDGASALLIF